LGRRRPPYGVRRPCEIRPDCDRRSVARARLLREDPDNDAVLALPKYESCAWAVGIALIWADLVLPIPQTAVIAALGDIYGTLRPPAAAASGSDASGLPEHPLLSSIEPTL
jgi:hypothetical protein